MISRRPFLALLFLSLAVAAVVGGTPAAAAPPDDGKQWRSLRETTRVTWSEVAQICPRDGVTPCSGTIRQQNFNTWVWATPDQVVALMGHYAPEILTANPPSVGGEAYFGQAYTFLSEAMAPTGSVTGYNFQHTWASGWTASTDDAGVPMSGWASYGWWPPAGGLGVGADSGHSSDTHGVWLWRPSDRDYSPPVITPILSGTLGSNGWFVSDVSVTWQIQDAESGVTSRAGCDPATVTTDTAGTTLTCQATSEGGTASASVIVRRDTTPPTVTCPSPAPVFQLYQLGAWVTASVVDATSGRANAPAQGITNTSAPGTFTTSVTGGDLAGHRTTTQCSYQVVIPACNGLTPTRVGTAQNDVINGTTARDVIVGMGGADTINGLAGDDVICGGDGPDLVYGGDGKDSIYGEASPDDLNGDKGDDFLDGGLHNDSLRGGDGKDICTSGEVRMSSCEP